MGANPRKANNEGKIPAEITQKLSNETTLNILLIRSLQMKNHAYVFDAYGTLLDIQAASQKHSRLLGKKYR